MKSRSDDGKQSIYHLQFDETKAMNEKSNAWFESLEDKVGVHSRLNYISLERFKGFESVRIDLGGFTVIVGENASGKSNLRDALRFLHGISKGYSFTEIIGGKWGASGIHEWLGIRGGANEIAFAGSDSFAIEIGLSCNVFAQLSNYLYRLEISETPKGRFVTTKEHIVDENTKYPLFDAIVHNQSGLADSRKVRVNEKEYDTPFGIDTRGPIISQLLMMPGGPIDYAAYMKIHGVLDAFGGTRFFEFSPEAMRMPSSPGAWHLGDRGENLSSVLQQFCIIESQKSALIKWIRELAPIDVADFRFKSDLTGRILVFLVDGNGNEVSPDSASDGTLRFLATLTAMLSPSPVNGCYFFEEIDSGLHPSRLHLLTQLIEGQVRTGKRQVIATTHSPQLLSFLSPETVDDVIVAYRMREDSSQRMRKLADIPDAQRLVREHSIVDLHSRSWFEDAIFFSQDGSEL